MRLISRFLTLALCSAALPAVAEPVTVSNTKDGDLLPVKVDADTGKVLITLPSADASGAMGRFLYSTTMRTGMGSAPSASTGHAGANAGALLPPSGPQDRRYL
jgi:hypothetical protein